MRGDPAPARAGRRNSGACRKDSGIDTRARWPADKSCAQCFNHRAQRRWIYASPDPQPLAGRQHQFQNNICGSLRPNGSCFHQCESHRLPLSQPLPPIVEGLFRNLLLPTKLLHGHPAALLRSNPFAPTFFSVSDFLFHAGSLPSWPTMRDPNRIKNSGSQGAYNLYILRDRGSLYGLHKFQDGVVMLAIQHECGDWITLSRPTETQVKYFEQYGDKV